ncbi:dentin sialophosphoprotein-like [Apis laboriosa]|uniref:dentin sialophosphoprotein-like n=1 Tax=Apis laboriosa TaxID=183418 RepID=UPI001CC6739B|nr:dentin sialophosphoprotein-like [Apis laboriosa]
MLEHAYRKRRDTYNKHALHQTVPSREQADEPPSTGVAGGEGAATSPRSPEAERSAPFTDDRPRGVVVVHDKEHAGPNSSPTSSSLSSPSSSSSMSSSTSSTPAGTHLLLDVSRSSTANNHYSHDPSSATPSTLRPSSPINPTTDPSSYSPSSSSSSSSSSSFSSSSSVSFTDESQPPPSKNHLANDLTPRSSIIDEQIADSSYVPRTTTESGTGIPGAYAGVAFPEVGSNGFRGEEVESITIAKQEDDGTVSGVEVEVESRVEGGGGTTASIAYDHQRNVSSKDAKDAVALVVVGEHEVDAAPPGRAWTKSLEEVKKKRKEEEEEEEGGREGVESGPRDTARNSSSDFSGVVKETRELSREDSSSSEEDVGWPSRAKSYEKSEELLQRDYPSPIYNYNGQDEVEFVKLNHGNETTTGKSNDNDNDDDEDDVVDEDDGDDNDDDRGPISFGDDEVKTNDVPPSIGDLRVITREESDEEFLREFERKFHEEADSPAARGREGGEGASIESNSAESRNPPTQQVKIIEVPVDRSRRPSTSSSTPSSPNRVLVNITIASGDSASAASRPLYVLSVSVPTGGDGVADGEERDGGTRGREEEREGASERVHRAGPARRQEASSQMAEIASPVEGNDNRLPPPPQPPSSPPPPMWAGGECECSCPCMGSSSDEWDNDFSPVDETMSLEGPREGQSRNTSESVDEPDVVRTVAADTRQVETREEGNSVSSVSLEETVKGETSSQHDYFSGTEENSSTIDWTTSNYGSESSGVGVSGCSGATPLPPEPTILILEGARTFPARSFPPDGTTFAQVGLGQKLSKEIPPYSYWNMQFYQSEAAYVRFDYNIPRGASIGVYARRNALPTHTQYDLLEVLSGFKARTARASHVSVIVCATAPFLFFFFSLCLTDS